MFTHLVFGSCLPSMQLQTSHLCLLACPLCVLCRVIVAVCNCSCGWFNMQSTYYAVLHTCIILQLLYNHNSDAVASFVITARTVTAQCWQIRVNEFSLEFFRAGNKGKNLVKNPLTIALAYNFLSLEFLRVDSKFRTKSTIPRTANPANTVTAAAQVLSTAAGMF